MNIRNIRRLLFVVTWLTWEVCADVVKIGAVVFDDATSLPITNAEVCFSFKEDVGGQVWTGPSKHHKIYCRTDLNGYCTASGESNCGQAGCYVKNPPDGYYPPERGWKNKFASKNLFGVWQPDNLVVTIRLQRVEHPIPLFVKRVELRNLERGIGGFDGTNCVLRFDLVKGDWLPPYGSGKEPDIMIRSELKITDKERKYRYATKRVEDVLFYELANCVSTVGDDNFIQSYDSERTAGIRIREAKDSVTSNGIIRVKGMRKKISKNRNWHCEYFSNADQSHDCVFRIRSRCNELGELIDAYYGKMYGDFEFEGDDKKGLIGVKFLYYLNPKSLDRNLEWDMKNNLCPNPGSLGMPQP